MNVVITGHTSGLGRELYLRSKNNAIGLSRSNGYDLTKNLDDFCVDFDIFFNNAYSGWKQVDLLYKLFEKNKDRKCMIVNIGSVSADGNYDVVNKYAVHKSALDKACTQLQLIDSECKVIQIKLGRMDTPLVANKIARKMDPAMIADIIHDTVSSIPEECLLKTFTLDLMNSRRPL